MQRVAYTTETDRTDKIDEQIALGNILALDEHLLDGRFLTFESPDEKDERELGATVQQKMARILFQHENRIRALEGRQQVTKAQFANALQNL